MAAVPLIGMRTGVNAADRRVVRRAALLVGLGNYTHPTTRHSIGQCVLAPVLRCAERHDATVREEVARRVARLPPGAALHELPARVPTDAFRSVRAARGWLARVSVLLDAAPPRGAAIRQQPDFSLDAYPYVMLDLVVYIPKLLMNINGGGVAAAAAQYPELHVPNDILLVHDELSREFGKVSFKSGGSASGHNGVRSVQSVLRCHGEARGEPDVARVRLGIGRPPDGNVSSWVLSEMPSAWLAACGVGETADPRSAALPQRVWESVQQWCLAKVKLPT